LTNTVSADGSISGVYHAGMQLAEQTGGTARKELVGTEDQMPSAPPQKPTTDQPKDQNKQTTNPTGDKNR